METKKMRKSVAILIFIMVVIFMCMLIAGVGVFGGLKNWVYANSVNDKITHITFAIILTVLANFIFYPRVLRIFSFEIPPGSLLLAALFFLDEASQAILPGRDADLLDLAASYTGLLVGHLIFILWKRSRSAKDSQAGLPKRNATGEPAPPRSGGAR